MRMNEAMIQLSYKNSGEMKGAAYFGKQQRYFIRKWYK